MKQINIRLAGFGGNVPTDEFDDRTEKTIKQFQRDYMQKDKEYETNMQNSFGNRCRNTYDDWSR